MKNETTILMQSQAEAIALNPETMQAARDLNGTLTQSGAIRNVFFAHYADMSTGESGIADLICLILREHDAIFPKGVESTELRPIAVAGSMFTSEILAEVQARFTAGSTRYPLETVKHYLSTTLREGKAQAGPVAIVGKIQLQGCEDSNRTCRRPRCKYYLIK